MAIADRAAAFLSQMRTAAAPAVQQMGNAAQQAGQSIAQTYSRVGGQVRNQVANYAPMGQQALGQIGTAVGSALVGTPSQQQVNVIPNFTNQFGKVVQSSKYPYAASVSSTLPTGGLLGTVGLNNPIPGTGYTGMQQLLAHPGVAQAVGAGVVGAGALGLTAAAMQQKGKQRKAGEHLGAQLGVGMPPQY